jgi:anti-sigma B factor antagonist
MARRASGSATATAIPGTRARPAHPAVAPPPDTLTDTVLADLSQVSFIDAAGLRALGRAAGQAAAHGGSVHAICGHDHILRLFHLTGLDQRIGVTPTLTEALQSDQRS